MLGKKDSSILGLDVGSGGIKAVELTQTKDKLTLTGFAFRSVHSVEEQVEAISALLQEHHFRSNRVVTGVSGRSVIVRYVTMMQMTDEELSNAIKYEAEKYIPFDIQEVVLDYQKLEENIQVEGSKSLEMKVLLVAAKRDVIDEHISLLDQVGLDPVIVDVDSFALGNAFFLKHKLGPKIEEDDSVISLIDIGSVKTNINIIRGDMSYFTREVYLGGSEFTKAIAKRLQVDEFQAEAIKKDPGENAADVEECIGLVLEDLGNEIQLSFDYFENQFDMDVSEVYLSGGGSLLTGLDSSLSAIFGRPTQYWNPLEGLEIECPGVTEEDLEAVSSQMAIAIGLASRVRTKG